jgi:hypothetical protein
MRIMKTVVASSITTDLWEAWIDLESGNHTLYVVGDICMGRSKIPPVLLKKSVQGAAASHLILEVLPFFDPTEGRLAEVGYTEPVSDIHQYQQISICAGEEIIASIPDIELFY